MFKRLARGVRATSSALGSRNPPPANSVANITANVAAGRLGVGVFRGRSQTPHLMPQATSHAHRCSSQHASSSGQSSGYPRQVVSSPSQLPHELKNLAAAESSDSSVTQPAAVPVQGVAVTAGYPTGVPGPLPESRPKGHAGPMSNVEAGQSSTSQRILWDLGLRSLVPEWKRMFGRETLVTDITAGLTVGCVAIPLSLAIAVASGVPPEVGLVSAAVAGVAGGLMGGTTLAITGPAAAISLLVCEAVSHHGLSSLPFITLVCGVMQLATGILRKGGIASYVPESVVAGFNTGIGMMILTGQLPKALDVSVPAGLSTFEVFSAISTNIGNMNPAALAMSVGVVSAMHLLPKVHPKIPSALIAVGGGTAAYHLLGLKMSTIGALPSGLEAFQMWSFALPAADSYASIGVTIMLIYAMTSAESLLSCHVIDKARPTMYKHNPDQELIGQGLANMTSAAFMGMPVTAVIARSSLNIKLQAHTRMPSMVQSAFVFGSLTMYSSAIATIPLSALAGVLITSGAGMLKGGPELKNSLAEDKHNVVPYLVTTASMLTFGMAEGIALGCTSALAKRGVQRLLQSRTPQDASKVSHADSRSSDKSEQR